MTTYQDRSTEIEKAVAEACRLWREAYQAFSEHRRRDGTRYAEQSARYARLARKLAWIPARREEEPGRLPNDNEKKGRTNAA